MPYEHPRHEATPLPEDQVAFWVDGSERLSWHFGRQYPRPFFYPLLGPTGSSLTRMGHPGAANHDHHRSVWFAHNKVLGVDFWSDRTEARIRQKHWLAYRDGPEEAAMAVQLGWYDGHDPRELLDQELIAAAGDIDGETLLELQSTFTPKAESLEFGKTNFGFLAVRVAKSISAYFGGGRLTDSEGRINEPAIFGRQARWMDYSGPVPVGEGKNRKTVVEGITYFDHPDNPRYPSHWHVREDGWMGASVCMKEPLVTTRANPLTLRYLLWVHRGEIDTARAEQVAKEFANRGALTVVRSRVKHTQYEIERKPG